MALAGCLQARRDEPVGVPWRKATIKYLLGQLAGSAQAQPLIDGQRQHSEHEMRHDLRGAAYANLTGSEFVFQPDVHPT